MTGFRSPLLFCPKCAEPMQRVGAELTCAAGDMSLSRVVEDALLDRFGTRARGAAPPPPPGRRYYCPACRIPLGAGLACESCGGTVADLVFPLVELHPHK